MVLLVKLLRLYDMISIIITIMFHCYYFVIFHLLTVTVKLYALGIARYIHIHDTYVQMYAYIT